MKIFDRANATQVMFLVFVANMGNAMFFLVPLWNYYDMVRLFTVDPQIVYDPRWQDLMISLPILIQYILLSLLGVSIVRMSREVKSFREEGMVYSLNLLLMFSLGLIAFSGLVTYLRDGSVDSIIGMLTFGVLFYPIVCLGCGLFGG